MLSGAIPAFEMFMTRWEKLAKEHPTLEQTVRAGLDWAYKYYKRMDGTKAYVVAMCQQIYLLTRQKLIISAVLNPAVRLSWFRKHWEKKFIVKAEKNIRELVGFVFTFLNGVSSSASKMAEYRKTSATSHGEDEEQSARGGTDHGRKDRPKDPLKVRYGIEDELDTGDTDENVQTVEQEYQAYITGALSAKTVDLLKFWEVNSNVM